MEVKIKDLSTQRQLEFEDIKSRYNIPEEWATLALTFKPKENWERFGFGLFLKDDFKKQVQNKLDKLQQPTVQTAPKDKSYSREDYLQMCLDDLKNYSTKEEFERSFYKK